MVEKLRNGEVPRTTGLATLIKDTWEDYIKDRNKPIEKNQMMKGKGSEFKDEAPQGQKYKLGSKKKVSRDLLIFRDINQAVYPRKRVFLIYLDVVFIIFLYLNNIGKKESCLLDKMINNFHQFTWKHCQSIYNVSNYNYMEATIISNAPINATPNVLFPIGPKMLSLPIKSSIKKPARP